MTALMCQVTCTLCKMKINETNWKSHQTSESHLKSFKNVDNKIAIKFFEMIFEARPEIKKIFNLKIEEKKHPIAGAYIFYTKLPKEKSDILCNDSNDNMENEKNLTSDLNNFVLNVVPIIGKKCFSSIKVETF